jgi:glycerate 2-kinase
VPRSPAELRADALAIWHAGVEAVRSDRLVHDNVRIDGDRLVIGGKSLDLASIGKIAVVGAGKAGAGMAAGLIAALGEGVVAEKYVRGWLNVPADCVPKVAGTLRVPSDSHDSSIVESQSASMLSTSYGTRSVPTTLHLHAARPAGVNEPTGEGIYGAEQILKIVSSLGPEDLCLCLISGGGSALLPAPVPGVSLAEKQAVTRLLSGGGANIRELNTVRKQLSRIKGGGLARACRAGRLIALIISDVLGDPLDVIASGPTVVDSSTPAEALAILKRYAKGNEVTIPSAMEFLRERAAADVKLPAPSCQVTNLVIGNNAVAVEAAGREAQRLGYSPELTAATSLEGAAEQIGIDLARRAMRMLSEPGPDCLITGGEPTVKLAPPELRGTGGRNQQLVLAALVQLLSLPLSPTANLPLVLLAGGTDGEDGPTDAAGALVDGEIIAGMREKNLDPTDYLRRNDAYHFFQPLGGLIQTGPTHTNVCDVRVTLVDR